VTSGYAPLGGVQISEAIADSIQTAPDTDLWMHGYTYSGHAMACAVALANLDIIEGERLAERSRALGPRLLAGLEKMLEFPFVGEVRGIGLLCGVEIVTDKATKQADMALAGKISKLCLERGLRTRMVGSTLAFSPPLVISEDEIDWIISTLGAVMDSV
jgi:putrescine---pyruvate transaminase